MSAVDRAEVTETTTAVLPSSGVRAPVSLDIEALEQQLAAKDVEIEDALAKLHLGELTDDDVAAKRAERSRIDDRLRGARTNAKRAEEQRAAEALAARHAELARCREVVDTFDVFLQTKGEEIAKLASQLWDHLHTVEVRMHEQGTAARTARLLIEELQTGDGVPMQAEWLHVINQIKSIVGTARNERSEDPRFTRLAANAIYPAGWLDG